MSTTRKFFHDRFVLFLISVNSFLLLLSLTTVLFRLGNTGDDYLVQFRSNLGLDGYLYGGVNELISFPIFAAIIFAAQFIFGTRMYKIRKQAGWIVLALCTLLLVLGLIVSNALLQLH